MRLLIELATPSLSKSRNLEFCSYSCPHVNKEQIPLKIMSFLTENIYKLRKDTQITVNISSDEEDEK